MRVDHVQVPSFDETSLDGWIVRPARGSGRVPVVLWSAPYFGTTYPSGNDPDLWTNSNPAFAVPVNLLVSRGYAVAIFNVRGTGNSGGCFDWFGPDEQRDQAFLVEWLAARPWSNGRVGMMGLSYHGTTPWEAAIQNPPHLRTIVVAGMISDAYLFTHTPQGATFTIGPAFENAFVGFVGGPAVDTANLDPSYTAKSIALMTERLCPEVAEFMATDWIGLVSRRTEGFWAERRLIDRFPKIRASVLLTHGFQDLWGSGHQSQESEVWPLLSSPKREIKGQWGHEFPNFNSIHSGWVVADWNRRLVSWLDYWLKGVGRRPLLDRVSYQDGTGRWHESRSWPPAEARREVLHLSGTTLSRNPRSGDVSFRALPRAIDYPDVYGAACADAPLPGDLAAGRIFMSKPLRSDVTVAGNPFVYLTLRSDQPGGQVSVQLVDVGPNAPCPSVPLTTHPAIRPISHGTADLRYHSGNYAPRDFPVGKPTKVRIDLTHLAERIAAGHRLGLVVSRGDLVDRVAIPYAPRVTVGGASEVVLPVTEGSLGGRSVTRRYPPRPFLPPARND